MFIVIKKNLSLLLIGDSFTISRDTRLTLRLTALFALKFAGICSDDACLVIFPIESVAPATVNWKIPCLFVTRQLFVLFRRDPIVQFIVGFERSRTSSPQSTHLSSKNNATGKREIEIGTFLLTFIV
jgi:hypothetical protein